MHYVRGRVARQAHVAVPSGTVEEEFGRQGFFGRNAHLYRSRPPVDWTHIDEGLRPRSLDTRELRAATAPGWLASRTTLLHNQDVSIQYARLTEAMDRCFRNADGDEVLFVHEGSGQMLTDFGALGMRTGDYLVIPRGTTYRISPDAKMELLVVQSRDEVSLPDKGLLGQHALFDPAMIDVPTPDEETIEDREWKVDVLRAGQCMSITYPFDPLNTVGYKGDLTVWRINVADIRPIISERYHLPPSAHATFVTSSAVICTFLPRGLETGDPEALRVPFYHSNIDYDEVLFYHAGEFFSRAGVGPGMLTFHPQGIHHGPQPQAVAAAHTRTRTNEIAVMVDTVRPLELSREALGAQNPDYWKSWQGEAK